MTSARDIVVRKRDGGVLEQEHVDAFFRGLADGDVTDAHAGALLMAIFVRGMEREELLRFTRGMLGSGEVLRYEAIGKPVVDKHSTGGIGDKASLPLAPLLASVGLAVPMISGRGLGHTGGTLDKLEAIPGMSTAVDPADFEPALRELGVVFAGQTARIAPADRKLYALRDVVGLVESIPLIASSILSKKLAEGLDALVLDVKFGSGAFMPEVERGRELARTMVELARGFGVATTALLTNMERPLGRAVGHANEVRESIECLRGGGPADLRELVLELGAEVAVSAGAFAERGTARERLERGLDDGSALELFARTVERQGGDRRAVDEPGSLPSAPESAVLEADRDGYLVFSDLRAVGAAVAELGGGRLRVEDRVDPRVGVDWCVQDGERVERGRPICEVAHAGRGLERALALLRGSFAIEPEPRSGPLVLERVN
ncbi:MAG: thymidine phosphorylase [Planctomycetota bacterium]